jgi:hypothetical protein
MSTTQTPQTPHTPASTDHTPGPLRTQAKGPLRHWRRFEAGGEICVSPRQAVTAATLLGNNGTDELLHFLRVEVDEGRLLAKLLRNKGDDVKRGEPVAYYMYMFGLGYREYVSPVNGSIVSVDHRSGLIAIREHPRPLYSGIDGEVSRAIPGYGVEVTATGAEIEATAGWGGSAWGPLAVLAPSPSAVIDPAAIGPAHAGKVLVVGAAADAALIAAAYRHGVRALIAGGVHALAAAQFALFAAGMTYEEYQARYYTHQPAAVGAAGSGAGAKAVEAPSGLDRVLMPLLATDGLGRTPIRPEAWSLLAELAGRLVLVDAADDSGALWAGSRPRLLAADERHDDSHEPRPVSRMLAPGARVRIVGGKHGGLTGAIAAVDAEVTLETGYRAAAAAVELAPPGGEKLLVPLVNLEVLA